MQRVSAVALAAGLTCSALGFPGLAAAAPVTGLVLSEVFYDRSGGDNGFEWVELFNGTGAVIDLSQWSLGWGGLDYTFGTQQLSGLVAAGEYAVVGGPESDASNGSPLFAQAVDLSPDLQNSGTLADGVGLFRRLASAIAAQTVPDDAVIYGQTNASGLLDAGGRSDLVHVGDAPSGASIGRIGASAWAILDAPSPGTGPLVAEEPPPAPVPEPPPLLLLAIGLTALRCASRHRSAAGTSAAWGQVPP